MRTFVITDIHGNNEAFRKALKYVKLKKTDTLILLGDYIDKGYDSKGVLDTILLLQESGFNLICLKGNHEQMLLDSLNDTAKFNNWILNGGKETLSSFLTSSIEKIPIKYIELLNSFKYYHLTENFIFVHAALNMNIENPFEDIKTILWERNPEKYLNSEWLQGRFVIHGHNPTNKDSIYRTIESNEQFICLDNGAFLTKDGFGSVCIFQLENFNLNFIT